MVRIDACSDCALREVSWVRSRAGLALAALRERFSKLDAWESDVVLRIRWLRRL